jgi:hypothetical protein
VRILREDSAELVHYTLISEGSLLLPRSLDRDPDTRDIGLFRGRFGSDATDHEGGELAIWQPFRYWDRYTERRSEDNAPFSGVFDHPETSYVELGRSVQSALWRGFTWQENLIGLAQVNDVREPEDSSSGYLDLMVLARFNPHVPWDTKQVVDLRKEHDVGRRPDLQALSRTHLFVFDDQGGESMRSGELGNLLNLESDTAEFRVYFAFRPGAWVPLDTADAAAAEDRPEMVNWWKRTPWLSGFRLTYMNRTTTRWRAPVR